MSFVEFGMKQGKSRSQNAQRLKTGLSSIRGLYDKITKIIVLKKQKRHVS